MKTYSQFCSIARALDLLGERWTLLIVRELLCGSTRFGDLRRGIPRISRTMLSARLRELLDAGVIARHDGEQEPGYKLTAAGLELAVVVRELGTWASDGFRATCATTISTRICSSGTCAAASTWTRFHPCPSWRGSNSPTGALAPAIYFLLADSRLAAP